MLTFTCFRRQGYDFVTTFGGRGFSILDPVDMSRVYDSGDDFERYFTTPEATEPEKAMFNGNVGSNNSPQSSQVDRASPVLVRAPGAARRRHSMSTSLCSASRPDMTFAVDWALTKNYLSIYTAPVALI